MTKRNLVGKIFGIVLVLAMIGSMLGGLPALVGEVEASPATIYVPDNYPTIQAAVNAANPGDTIIVRAGTYIENTDVGKDHLTIRSESGAETTIVQAANPNDHVFEITTNYVTVTGFTVTGASSSWMAGIILCIANHCEILNNTVVDNCYGIALSSSSGNFISNNTAKGNVHGIHLFSSSNNNSLSHNNVMNNSGFGIYLLASHDNTVCNITATNNSEGVYLESSLGNRLYNIVATSNIVGIDLCYSSNNNDVAYNTISMSSLTGIYLRASSGNNTLTNNTVLNNWYGIYLDSSSNNAIYLNNFINNTSGNVVSSTSTGDWNSPEEITYTYNGKTYTNYLGNYWSDYEDRYPGASEIDSTEIWDTPYAIDSDADNYPLREPFENYEIVSAHKTWYVDDDLADYPAADFTTIQDAVNASSSGDTIIVYPGTYTENVDLNKDYLTIQSENGPEVTIVQAANADDHVFELTSNYTAISGFTVKGATGSQKAGIYLYGASYCNITNNSATSNYDGISLVNSSNSQIEDCIIYANYWWGIIISVSQNNTITNCTCHNNNIGIELYFSPNNKFRNNSLENNEHNLGFTTGVLNVSYYYQDIDTSNTINGQPIYYIVEQSDLKFDETTEVGFIGLVCCTNIEVTNIDTYGILLANVSSSIINNCISHDSCSGIELGASSCNNYIMNCTCYNNFYGISLLESSNNNRIADCVCDNNVYYGIFARQSSGNDFTNCIVYNNWRGIWLYYASSNNTITFCNVADNDYGVYIDSTYHPDDPCINNLIYLNNFIDNVDNAHSENSPNIWNSPEEITYTYNGNTYTSYLGNYWSDYTERYPGASEIDSTGIWDTPYSIDSDNDNYPLVEPFENYVIGPENQPPVGSFTCSPENPFSGDVVYFDASSSYDPDGTIVSHEWDFGDGDTATGQQVTHRFRGAMGEAKEYTVELMIEDDKGATDSNTHTITVYPLMRYTTVYSSLCQFLPPPVPPIMEVVVYYNWVDVKDGKDEYIVSEVHLYSEEGLNFALYMFSIEDDGEKVWSKIHKGVGKEDISFTYPFGVPRDCVKSIGDEHFEGLVVGSNSKLNFLVYGVELGLQLKPSFFRVSRTVEFGPGKQTELLPICPEGTPGIVATVASPVELRVYDLDGNITGLVDGEIREGIPDSTYDGQSGTCVIFSPEDIASCYYEIVGVDIGTYGLEIIAVKDGEANTFAATDIPTAPGAVHQYTIDWDVLSQGGEGVTVQIDSDGDGEFEDTFTSDGELTQDEFLHETIPQLLKQDAISNLEVIKPTKKTAQRLIDNSIQSINKSLSNRLWADDSHLNSRMMVGTLVFDMEKAAVLNLKATERVEPTIENEIEAVIDKLTEADKLLCIIAINDAKSIEVKDPWAKRIVDWQITKAEEELDKAYEYLDKDMPDKAITHFKLAWIHAEATGAASPASHRRG